MMLCPKCSTQLEVKEGWDLDKVIYSCHSCGYSIIRTIPQYEPIRRRTIIGPYYEENLQKESDT